MGVFLVMDTLRQRPKLSLSKTDHPRMAFTSMKLKPESGANLIKSADDAYSFMAHMRLSYQNKPHWQVARQAINNAAASDASEIRAWRTFREAAGAEGWLVE
jgi:hypothetical protein